MDLMADKSKLTNDTPKAGAPSALEPTAQRQRILTAATRLLAQHGAEGLRVRDVAAAAECSTMGVYSHFGGKNGLVEAIFIDGFNRFENRLRQGLGGPSGADRFDRLTLAYRDWAFDNPGAYAVMFAGVVPGFEPSDEALASASNAFHVLVECVADEQAQRRLSEPDTDLIAHTLWALVHGLVMIEFADMTPPGITGARNDRFFLSAMRAGMSGFASPTGRRARP